MNVAYRRRKARENRRNRYILMTFVVALLLMIIASTALSNEIQGEVDASNKVYISIQVDREDTLWSIAKEYKNSDFYDQESFINEVININHIVDEYIYAGEVLVIPYIPSQQ